MLLLQGTLILCTWMGMLAPFVLHPVVNAMCPCFNMGMAGYVMTKKLSRVPDRTGAG